MKDGFGLLQHSFFSKSTVFYHTTFASTLPKVLEEGLIPQLSEVARQEAELMDEELKPHINLWGTIEDAKNFGEFWVQEDYVILEIRIPTNVKVETMDEGTKVLPPGVIKGLQFGVWYRVYEPIPPTALRVVRFVKRT